MKQKTIRKSFSLSGIGLHTGEQVKLTFYPAEENYGIQFIRIDLPGQPAIKAQPERVMKDQGIPRCTSIGRDGVVIHTIEHLMSVLCGVGITNLRIEIIGREVPGLDGSGLEFLKGFQEAGLVEQEGRNGVFPIQEPLGVYQNDSFLYIVPMGDFKISYLLDYNHPLLRSQLFNVVVNAENFAEGIAPCRTFCLESEEVDLRKGGLGKGANYQNTLVVGKTQVLDNQVRFPDEFARHKVLDLIGDLYLLGCPIQGHIFAFKSGHYLNIELLNKIHEQKRKLEHKDNYFELNINGKREIDIHGIMKILPHRYPFLLVDRDIEIVEGKKAIGIKNVTMNEPFFQGHFPTRAIMPGVLMVEAMAQTAGVVVLTNEAHRGKVAFFLSAERVKFRKVVVPGDQLVMEVEVVRDKSKIAQIRALAKVNNEIVAEADMVFSFTDASYLEK